MTLSYAYRCDICGECVYVPLDRPTEAIPDDWATLTVKHPTDPERVYKGYVCAICAKALESGESVEIWKARKRAYGMDRYGAPIITVSDETPLTAEQAMNEREASQ